MATAPYSQRLRDAADLLDERTRNYSLKQNAPTRASTLRNEADAIEETGVAEVANSETETDPLDPKSVDLENLAHWEFFMAFLQKQMVFDDSHLRREFNRHYQTLVAKKEDGPIRGALEAAAHIIYEAEPNGPRMMTWDRLPRTDKEIYIKQARALNKAGILDLDSARVQGVVSMAAQHAQAHQERAKQFDKGIPMPAVPPTLVADPTRTNR